MLSTKLPLLVIYTYAKPIRPNLSLFSLLQQALLLRYLCVK